MEQTSFRVYAAVTAVLVAKLVLLALATGAVRIRRRAFIAAEDTRLVKGEVKSDPLVERIGRAHANALENVPLFAIVGLLYVLLGAPTSALQIYAYTFLVARVAHTIAYLLKLQPFRTIAFQVGALCILGMCVQVVLRAFH